MWIKLKKTYGPRGKRIEWQAEWLPTMTPAKLRLLRGIVWEEYRRQWPNDLGHTPLGFVPSHVADPVLRHAGIELQGLDFIMLRFAITQDIMLFETGTWESGPTGEGERLVSPLPPSVTQ